MIYCLDTNTCIYFLKGQSDKIQKNISKFHPGEIKIPSLVKGELLLGAYKSNNRKRNKDIVLNFLDPFEILGFGNTESEICAELRRELESKGKSIGPSDLLIASIVLAYNGTLVTNNEKEFKRVASLKVENWL
ncbi:type II toxin-antitoxin system VapC family toxin [Leptospira fluminis]|uniref:Type II toxin-antitoxin system VapC family toxin n=1 Tax=Leptospira fluminis TaxID=2484979 RepID=A0A4R9GMW7_9LEPT|nr:type II toxin-antitoxin system VapC family toxin [Leptospira fluminis]TGK17837.1 type II toxin-antitoxin system VapC family toxin [Leptospira fluminis]